MKGFAAFKMRYERFMEKQGFYWLCGFCAAVIIATAVWTHRHTAFTAPQPPAWEASESQDEGLAQARQRVTLPEPTPAPLVFKPPLGGKIIRSFSASEPVYFEHTGHWQLHAACDYAAPLGEPVKAIAPGTVLFCDSSQVIIQHPQGYESRYLGLASAPYVQAGDPVTSGQTLGHVGRGPLYEQSDEPHLHLEVLQNGHSVDPQALF